MAAERSESDGMEIQNLKDFSKGFVNLGREDLFSF